MNPYPVGQVCPVPLDELGDQLPPLSAPRAPGRQGHGAVAPPLGPVRADRGHACARNGPRCSMASPAGRPRIRSAA